MSTATLMLYGTALLVALFLLWCLAACRRNSNPVFIDTDDEQDDEDELPYQPPYMRRGGQ